jgi:hypothetical protein
MVGLGALGDRNVLAQIHPVEAGVHHEKRVGVPEGVDEGAGHVGHDIGGPRFWASRASRAAK